MANTLRLVLLLCLFVCVPGLAQAASWSFSNVVSNRPLCDFDLSFDQYLESGTFLRELKTEVGSCAHALKLSGEIDESDMQYLTRLISFYRSNPEVGVPMFIHLNSPGGSVSVALQIAHQIRSPSSPLYQLRGAVAQDANCLSSCVLILAATFDRSVFGKVGIHRPRFMPDEYEKMGYENLQAAYNGLYDELSRFFRNANIHPAFIDEMWAIPSVDIRILSDDELKFFRLDGADLVLEEQRTMDLIRVCGESGPEQKASFEDIVSGVCADSRGKIDSSCFNEIFDLHPYADCHRKLYGD